MSAPTIATDGTLVENDAAGPEADDDAPPPLEPGEEVAPGYTVAALLRRGEDFDTYSAWSVTRYSHCVVKTPRPDRAHDASVRRILIREGRLLLAASHPHLCLLYTSPSPRD